MKLLRFGPIDSEKPGLLDMHGRIRDLSSVIPEITGRTISPESLVELAKVDVESLPVVDGSPRLGVPIGNIGKVVAIGLNYVDHAKESNLPIPAEPVVFMKATSSLCGACDDTIVPKHSQKLDWEVELGIVIGKTASYVSEADADQHIAGYCVVNDVSERYFQLERGGQWDKGKGCDTFGPVGPYLVTKDEVGDPQKLSMWLDVNDRRMQTGSTSNMIFNCRQVVSYVSHFMTLNPGDLIITGTPPGVGMGKSPPTFLKPGDVVTLGVEKLGSQRQSIRAFGSARVES